MGDLLFCYGTRATMPYYLEGVSINIYSAEELCYYIANNTYLLDDGLLTTGLCDWIKNELHLRELSERLAAILADEEKGLSDFVFEILKDSGYCTAQEIREIFDILTEMEEKSEFERNKIRADRLMEKEKYLACIYEYKQLLDRKEAADADELLLASIHHNLGVAYARMFLFEEAAECFAKAYGLSKDTDSLNARLHTYLLMNDQGSFEAAAREAGLSEEAIVSFYADAANADLLPETRRLRMQLERIRFQGDYKEIMDSRKDVGDMILRWKEEYRRLAGV